MLSLKRSPTFPRRSPVSPTSTRRLMPSTTFPRSYPLSPFEVVATPYAAAPYAYAAVPVDYATALIGTKTKASTLLQHIYSRTWLKSVCDDGEIFWVLLLTSALNYIINYYVNKIRNWIFCFNDTVISFICFMLLSHNINGSVVLVSLKHWQIASVRIFPKQFIPALLGISCQSSRTFVLRIFRTMCTSLVLKHSFHVGNLVSL